MAILPMLDALDESAARYQAVNCVAQKDGTLIGYNTDCDGFTLSVKDFPMNGKVLLVGCGGVGRMMALEALRCGADLTIGILPRHLSRVAAFVDDLKHQMPQASVRYALTEDLNEPFDVLLNASPVGMYPNSTDCPVSDALIDQADYFFDVIYNPTQTVLLRKAQAQGKVVMGGAAMLVLQAVRAHEIWNGDSYTPEQIASIIQEMEAKIDAQNAAK